jgi:hypothetical protein
LRHEIAARSCGQGSRQGAIPAHAPLKVGTLAAILADVAQNLGIERDELARQLFE